MSKRISLWFAILLFLAVLLALVSRLPLLQIRTVNVFGEKTVRADDVRLLVAEELGGAYFGLLSRRNSIIYPKRAIRTSILSERPRIAALRLEREGLNELSVYIEERTPVGLWCGGEAEFESASMSECYFLDASGFVFAQAGMFSRGVFQKFYGDLGTRSPIGATYSTSAVFVPYRKFLSELKAVGYEGERSLIQPNGSAIVISRTGERFLLSGAESFESELAYLGAVLASGELSGKKVEYFDLRFGNRVYYKLQEK